MPRQDSGPAVTHRQCEATATHGGQCRNNALSDVPAGSDCTLCHVHDPEPRPTYWTKVEVTT